MSGMTWPQVGGHVRDRNGELLAIFAFDLGGDLMPGEDFISATDCGGVLRLPPSVDILDPASDSTSSSWSIGDVGHAGDDLTDGDVGHIEDDLTDGDVGVPARYR